ncbi:MAG: PEP-CTERM sorting domain-containing protein [Chlorobaculum sp.]|nr:PEP-CTERM sorting domain-containing protein [Chlorobaculum sp.]
MKKLLSTIGLGIALMTGFAPSQAMAAITFVNTSTGPNTWTYDLEIVKDTLFSSTNVTLVTSGVMTGIDSPDGWTGELVGGGHTAIWTWMDVNVNVIDSWVIPNFQVTSPDTNGPVNWYVSTGGAGSTQGPVPEPATVMLLGIGGLLAGGRKLYESKKEEAAL